MSNKEDFKSKEFKDYWKIVCDEINKSGINIETTKYYNEISKRNPKKIEFKDFMKEIESRDLIEELDCNRKIFSDKEFFDGYKPNDYFKPERNMQKNKRGININIADIVDGNIDLKFNQKDTRKIDEVKSIDQEEFKYMDKIKINKEGFENVEFKVTRKLKDGYYEIEDCEHNKYKAHKSLILLKSKSEEKLNYNINPYDEYIIECKRDKYCEAIEKINGHIVNFSPMVGQIVIETKDGLYINRVSNIVYMKKKAITMNKIKNI